MDYKDIIKLLSNPDKVTEGLAELDAYNTALTKERDELKSANEASDKRIRDLQDSNMKLYLRIPGSPMQEDTEDDKDDFEKLMDKVRGND